MYSLDSAYRQFTTTAKDNYQYQWKLTKLMKNKQFKNEQSENWAVDFKTFR